MRSATECCRQCRWTAFWIPGWLAMIGSRADRQGVYTVCVTITVATILVPTSIAWRPHENRAQSAATLYQVTYKQARLSYFQLAISFLIGRKRAVNFWNQRLGRHLAEDYTIIMSRTLKVRGSQVRALCVARWFVYFYTFRNKLSLPLAVVTNLFSFNVQ